MEICTRCGISGNEVRLFDAICEGRMDVICERCSIIENIPIIKKPDSSQLKESEEQKVYKKMKQIAGMRAQKYRDTYFQGDRIRELDEHPELEKPEKEKLNLTENFHWEIMRYRRRKGLSQRQLAETINESEIAIQMIENGKLPEKPEPLIRKLEQFFQFKLRKISEIERIRKKQNTEPILLDEEGRELDLIPEEEPYIPEIKKTDREDEKQTLISLPQKQLPKPPLKNYIDKSKDLDLKKINPQSIMISDLKEMHNKKMEEAKKKMFEEQQKIEERRRILDALREKDRLKHEDERQKRLLQMQKIEQEKQKLKSEKQEQEKFKQKLIEQKKQELWQRKKQDADEIDKMLGGSELLKE